MNVISCVLLHLVKYSTPYCLLFHFMIQFYIWAAHVHWIFCMNKRTFRLNFLIFRNHRVVKMKSQNLVWSNMVPVNLQNKWFILDMILHWLQQETLDYWKD